MNALFSTAGLQPSHQFRYFRAAICEAVVRLDARRQSAGPYDAEIRTHGFGPLEFAEVRCDPVIIERTRHDIALDSGAFYFFTLQLEGCGRVLQRGREAVLHPGDFTLVDGSEPYTLRFDGPVRRLLVRVPHDELNRRAGNATDLRALPFAHSTPGAGLVFGTLRALCAETTLHAPEREAMLAACALDLAVAAMLSQRPPRGREMAASKAQRLALIRANARANLRDPELSPRAAAAAAGISVRYLHQLFRTEGASFSAWVRGQRLERCHAELCDRARAARSISEIAFSYGFNDMAHFSRVFTRAFGCPPRELRNRNRTTERPV